MAACDLCGITCHAGDMVQLRPCYQTVGVIDICPTCDKWATKELDKIRDGIAPAMRQKIQERVGKKPWWKMLTRRATTP